MKARFLDIQEYDEDGQVGETHSIPLNGLSDLERIKTAIRNLDRHRFPWITILQDDDDESDYMRILGGNGAYQIDVDLPELDRYARFINLDAGTEAIDIWTSDQGASVPARLVCTDLNKVLLIAEDYALARRFWGAVAWLLDVGVP